MLTDMIQNREIKIIKFLLKEGHTTVKAIADDLDVSEKTVSKSLKEVQVVLKKIGLSLVRKPKVGVYIDGDLKKILPYLDNKGSQIPTTRQERVIYIYSVLLKSNDYITIQQLSDELYISRGTIERDLAEVEKLLKNEGISIYKKPSKGIKLNISERDKRQLTAKFIHKFWSRNWYIKQEQESFYQAFEKIQADVNGIFSEDDLSIIIDILRNFSREREFEFSDYEFQSLVIHLAIAVERIRRGEYIEESLHTGNIENNQMLNTNYLATQLEEKFSILLPKSEIGYINLHLVAANQHRDTTELKNTSVNPYETNTNNISNLREIIKNTLYETAYDKDLIDGLTTHVHSSINRLTYGLSIKNPYVNTIKQNFSLSFEQALDLKKVIEFIYDIRINDDECAYIALHFEAFRERIKEFPQSIRVILVCSTGLGSSRLLSARIKKYFPRIKIEKILSVQELVSSKIDADLVISTIYLELENIPTIVVSPILNESDIRTLERNIQNISRNTYKKYKSFKNLIFEENILLNMEVSNYEDAIKCITGNLVKKGFAKEGIAESAIERERLSYTSFQSIATPHASPSYIKKSNISVATLKNPIIWGSENVEVIFFISLENDKNLELDEIYEVFYDFIDNKKNINDILSATSPKEVYDLLMEENI
ncbi:transcription antiterminator [Clostridioides sp. ES-S-0171-01]|uniref:BglG family transcription antiterminator n=2 Tax=unclassified Clostridioides TaxID=2635829 RepID=UPI001D11D0D5|nr:transcription antiterminator [Clostridioides sp. ES-S-0171-01]MCC0688773.1 transcription antiterminator [Clostridioides sp. ES-S-0056-01]MCC0716353.1 transcription antiterminator [Clostridioides sp. ES-S-0077-01]UDN54078.1 transcription antiterminator [Clostridioides sp. ES-S-0054-01]